MYVYMYLLMYFVSQIAKLPSHFSFLNKKDKIFFFIRKHNGGYQQTSQFSHKMTEVITLLG